MILLEFLIAVPLFYLLLIIPLQMLLKFFELREANENVVIFSQMSNVSMKISLVMMAIMILALIVYMVLQPKKEKESVDMIEEEESIKTVSEILVGNKTLSLSVITIVQELEKDILSTVEKMEVTHVQDEIHVLERMKTELPILLENYTTLTVKQQMQHQKQIETLLSHMKQEVENIKGKIEEREIKNFEQTVRTLETRYKQSEYL